MAASEEFKRRLGAAFKAVAVGQTFTYRRTFSEGDVALFCGVTGDFNPYHQDATFVAESWYGRLIIPGLLTGSMITHIGGMIGFLATEMNFQFKGAVYIGDTVKCVVTIRDKNEEKRWLSADAIFVNQHGATVLEAQFKGFPADVRLVPLKTAHLLYDLKRSDWQGRRKRPF